MTYQTIILASWAVFILVWIIASFNVKRDIKGGGINALFSRYYIIRLISIAFIVFIVIRTMTGVAKYNNASIIFENYLFTPSLTLGWIAAGFVILGVVFAIWARFHLGRNWSGVPSVKENHELISVSLYFSYLASCSCFVYPKKRKLCSIFFQVSIQHTN